MRQIYTCQGCLRTTSSGSPVTLARPPSRVFARRLRVLTPRPRCVPDEFDRAFELASGEPEGEETMAGRHVELFGGERTSTMFPVIDQRER